MERASKLPNRLASRRSFLREGLALGAGAAGTAFVGLPAFANTDSGITAGDAAILRFLAAAEILETDLWQQYNELGGIQDSEVPGGRGSLAYTEALKKLDGDMASTSMTTLRMNSHISRSSTPTRLRRVRRPSTWTSSAPCRAARPLERSKSAG